MDYANTSAQMNRDARCWRINAMSMCAVDLMADVYSMPSKHLTTTFVAKRNHPLAHQSWELVM